MLTFFLSFQEGRNVIYSNTMLLTAFACGEQRDPAAHVDGYIDVVVPRYTDRQYSETILGCPEELLRYTLGHRHLSFLAVWIILLKAWNSMIFFFCRNCWCVNCGESDRTCIYPSKKKCILSIYPRFLHHCFTSFHSKTIYSPFPLIHLSDNAFLSDHFLNKML